MNDGAELQDVAQDGWQCHVVYYTGTENYIICMDDMLADQTAKHSMSHFCKALKVV